MKKHDNNDKSNQDGIEIADLETLRKALGAAADLAPISAGAKPALASTTMCVDHPWDRK